MLDMMKGTHGTCVSRATSIRQNGFSRSAQGRRGSGVYFWGYTIDELELYVRNLAISWWRFAHQKRNDYREEEDPRCCVLFATLQSNSTDVFDFENQQIRDKFVEYSAKTLPRLTGSDDEKISTIYDMYLERVESLYDKKYKIIHVKVPQPSNFQKLLPLDITGQPSCFIVKDLSCITTDRFEEVNDE